MNRIILIGNGFDLAHDLDTGYPEFINYLWSKIIKEIQQSPEKEPFDNNFISLSINYINCKESQNYDELMISLKNYGIPYEIKNDFFRKISAKSYLNKWVDIENEYYQQLKELLEEPERDKLISKLNSDFESIILLLTSYLSEISKTTINKNSKIQEHVNSHCNSRDFNESYVNARIKSEYEKFKNIHAEIIDITVPDNEIDDEKINFYNKFNTTDPLSKIRKEFKSDHAWVYFDMFPKEVLFLNFNYTQTHSLYSKIWFNQKLEEKQPRIKSLQIHGVLDEKQRNPIIFGFGDELDDDYKSIEKLNNNDFLEYIKSMKYLETDNYKQLLEFLNSDSYQVFIFGHSCGISDRTLLNTLFENDNCISIKPFYYESNKKDNYSDITKNISRNFNNKVSMRDKVVNKTHCVPLSK